MLAKGRPYRLGFMSRCALIENTCSLCATYRVPVSVWCINETTLENGIRHGLEPSYGRHEHIATLFLLAASHAFMKIVALPPAVFFACSE